MCQRMYSKSQGRYKKSRSMVKVEVNVEVKVKVYSHILESLSQKSYFKVIRPMVIGVEGQGH